MAPPPPVHAGENFCSPCGEVAYYRAWVTSIFFAVFGLHLFLLHGVNSFITMSELVGGNFEAKYGIDRVSGLYGPGPWGGWLLLLLSILIDILFAKRDDVNDDGGDKTPMLGISPNIWVFILYPICAAIDLVSNMHHYFDDQVVSKVDVGRVDAPLVVLRLGILSVFSITFVWCLKTIMMTVTFDSWSRKHWSLMVTWISTLAVLNVINRVFDLRFCRYGTLSWVHAFLPVPVILPNRLPQSGLATLYESFARDSPAGFSSEFGLPSTGVGPFVGENPYLFIIFECLFFLIPLSLGLSRIWETWRTWSLRSLPYDLIYIFLATLLAYIPYQVFCESIFHSLMVFGRKLPYSNAHLSEISQVSAFVCGGVLPVVYSLHGAYKNHLSTLRAWLY